MLDIILNYFNQLPLILNQMLDRISGLSPLEAAWVLLFDYWFWIIILIIFFRYLAFPEYMFHINLRWLIQNVKYTILAIDVPKMNEQSVQAMENFFDHLLGAHGTFIWWQRYIIGEFQLSFSCEIVSIEGNIQFLIRTPSHWRNLVEAAIYAQYPDAEITEVEDYATQVPKDYPSETHDLWGCEFTLSGDPHLPIKTYMRFEHKFSETFVDPLAALLETMSQIGEGEKMFLQIVIRPLAVDWGVKSGKAFINKMLKIAPPPPKKGILGEIASQTSGLASEFAAQLAGVALSDEKAEEKKEEQFRMMNLTPLAREQLEATERKISKLAFSTKIRYVYIAEKAKFNKGIGISGMVGSIKQFTDMNLNGLKPDLKATGTSTPQYILIEYRRNTRKNYIVRAYIRRDIVMGSPAKPMTSEELASLWHFPSMYIKAPMLKMTEFKKAAAPVGLPMEEALPAVAVPKELEEVMAEKTQVIPTFDYDNDEFEKQFAKDKETFAQTRPEREKRLKEIAKEEGARFKKSEAKESEIGKSEAKESSRNKEETKDIPENLPFID